MATDVVVLKTLSYLGTVYYNNILLGHIHVYVRTMANSSTNSTSIIHVYCMYK